MIVIVTSKYTSKELQEIETFHKDKRHNLSKRRNDAISIYASKYRVLNFMKLKVT